MDGLIPEMTRLWVALSPPMLSSSCGMNLCPSQAREQLEACGKVHLARHGARHGKACTRPTFCTATRWKWSLHKSKHWCPWFGTKMKTLSLQEPPENFFGFGEKKRHKTKKTFLGSTKYQCKDPSCRRDALQTGRAADVLLLCSEEGSTARQP